jgi:oxaloacetate decarboxylase alpha subunit
MEAMKMETEICAHRAGTVAHVYVKEGETVNVGDPLLTIA